MLVQINISIMNFVQLLKHYVWLTHVFHFIKTGYLLLNSLLKQLINVIGSFNFVLILYLISYLLIYKLLKI